MSITLAIRQLVAAVSRNPKAVKYGAAGTAGAVGGWGLKSAYDSLSEPFTIRSQEGRSMNLLPILLIILIIYILHRKKVI